MNPNEFDTIEKIAQREVETFLNPATKRSIIRATNKQLSGFHLNYGMSIRNRYDLWHAHPLTNKWRTDVSSRAMKKIGDCSVDCSKDHPDSVSMQIIQRVWEILSGQTYVEPEVSFSSGIIKA